MNLLHRLLPVFVVLAATPALAAVSLTGSTPAAGAKASGVRTVTVSFSEPVQPALSGMDVVMTEMPGMEGMHHEMKIPGVAVKVAPDGRALVATMARPLPAGGYTVNWRAAGADGQRMTGKVTFAVTK
jgi:methionine-rich copper-binding protein CopC